MDFHSPVCLCVKIKQTPNSFGGVCITGKEWRKIEVIGNGAPWLCCDDFV